MSNNAPAPRTSDPASMVAATAGIVSPANAAKLAGQPASPAPAAPAAQPAATAPGSPAAPAAPVVAPEAPIKVSTPFGEEVFGSSAPDSEIKLSSFADVQAFAKTAANMDITEVTDLAKVITEYSKLKTEVAEVENLRKKVSSFDAIVKNLPEDVSLIFQAAVNNQDYKPFIQKLGQKAVVDFEQPFEAHDPVKVVNHYSGNSYNKEAFEALDPTVKSALLDSAKIKYSTDKEEFARIKTKTLNDAQSAQAAFSSSVNTSIANMQAANPNMDKAVVERVREIMTSGLGDRLFSANKTYLPDAAEKIAMMEFGKQAIQAQRQTIGDLVKKYTNAGASKATEDILHRSDKPLPAGGGAADPNQVAAAVKAATGFIQAK